MRSLLVLLGLSLSLIVSGCGTPPERRLESPALQVTALTPGSITLRLVNSNTVPVIINRAVHTLYLGDTSLGKFDDPTPVGIPPLGSDTHTVALPAKLGEAVRTYFAGNPGNLRVSVESTLVLAIGSDGTLDLKTVGSGVVTAP